MKSEVVTFGKQYKGQPVEAMLDDIGYCEWLLAQDWFKKKYNSIYQIVVNNFSEATETPEHNKLQTLFLDDYFCISLLNCLNWGDIQWDDRWKEECQKKYAERLQYAQRAYENNDYGWRQVYSTKEEIESYIVRYQEIIESLKLEAVEQFVSISHKHFEYGGWDVSFVFHCKKAIGKYCETKNVKINLEIKPTIGDDYPAILRQMKSNIKRNFEKKRISIHHTDTHDIANEVEEGVDYHVLVFDDFTATGATLEQVKQIFELSGFRVIQLSEIKEKMR